MRLDRYDSRTRLLAAASSWMTSRLHFETAQPGAYDDAEMELKDEQLLDAARVYVNAHAGVTTVADKRGTQ